MRLRRSLATHDEDWPKRSTQPSSTLDHFRWSSLVVISQPVSICLFQLSRFPDSVTIRLSAQYRSIVLTHLLRLLHLIEILTYLDENKHLRYCLMWNWTNRVSNCVMFRCPSWAELEELHLNRTISIELNKKLSKTKLAHSLTEYFVAPQIGSLVAKNVYKVVQMKNNLRMRTGA